MDEEIKTVQELCDALYKALEQRIDAENDISQLCDELREKHMDKQRLQETISRYELQISKW